MERPPRGKPEVFYKDSLLGAFMEDNCIDELRQLNTDFGLRPYRVYLIRTRWSGKRRGEGVETVFSEKEVTPTPKIDQISSLQNQLLDIGLDETGQLTVSEISPRYTETELTGVAQDGAEIPRNETFYWEVDLSRGDLDAKRRRRFVPKTAVYYDAENLQWTVTLTRVGNDRESDRRPG